MNNLMYQSFVKELSQKDYSESAKRFNGIGMLSNAIISIAGEAGELVDALKKHIMYGSQLNLENVREELGDIFFYLTMACNSINLSLSELQQINYDKLIKRYPNKVFTEEDALSRKDKS